MGHEEAFVKSFITPEKQARWTQFLSSPKRRKEILNQLNHDLPYITELSTNLASKESNERELFNILQAKGAGKICHVIVDGLNIDAKGISLLDALHEIFLHPFGAVISCIPGRLAYYKPESPNHGVLLERLSP